MTDVERDRFIGWCDQGVAAAEKSKAEFVLLNDFLYAERSRIESIALRMVALKLRSEQTSPPSVDPVRQQASIHKQESPMAKQYQGKPVDLLRDAKKGDPGFDAGKDQVVIKVGGAEKTVLRSEVTEA